MSADSAQVTDPETVQVVAYRELSTDIMGFRGQQNEIYINYLSIVKLLAYLVSLTNTSILVRKHISRKTILTLHLNTTIFLNSTMCLKCIYKILLMEI